MIASKMVETVVLIPFHAEVQVDLIEERIEVMVERTAFIPAEIKDLIPDHTDDARALIPFQPAVHTARIPERTDVMLSLIHI